MRVYKPGSAEKYTDERRDEFNKCDFKSCSNKHTQNSVFCIPHKMLLEKSNSEILLQPFTDESIAKIRKEIAKHKKRLKGGKNATK